MGKPLDTETGEKETGDRVTEALDRLMINHQAHYLLPALSRLDTEPRYIVGGRWLVS